MKYAIMASLSLGTEAKRDNLIQDFKTRLSNKPIWRGLGVVKGVNENGNPTVDFEVRFEQEADMDDLFTFIKDKMIAIPVLQGAVSRHNCSHDETPSSPCVLSEKYVK